MVDTRCLPFPRLNKPPILTAAATFDERTHDMIIQLAEELGLPRDTSNDILRALELKKDELNRKVVDKPEPPAKRARFGFRPELGGIPNYNSAVTVLLIALCPNITTLRFHQIDIETPLGQFLVLNNYGQLPKPFLLKLKHVQHHPVTGFLEDSRFYAYLRTLDDFRYVHRLPAVQSFSLEGFEDYQPDETEFPRKTSGITKITISHSDMSGEMIGSIMLIPKKLREFSLSTYGLMNTDGGTSVIDRRTIATCLREHRDCLKLLDLDAVVSGSHAYHDSDEECFHSSEKDEESSDTQAVIGTREWCLQQDKKDCSQGRLWADEPANSREYPPRGIGSLNEFTALTHLSIRIGLLLGYNDTGVSLARNQTSTTHKLIDLLPPNLEFLCFYGYRKGERPEVDEQVQELRYNRVERFPNLSEIQGVDEHIPGVPGSFRGDNIREEDLWVRPREGFDWLEVSTPSTSPAHDSGKTAT